MSVTSPDKFYLRMLNGRVKDGDDAENAVLIVALLALEGAVLWCGEAFSSLTKQSLSPLKATSVL